MNAEKKVVEIKVEDILPNRFQPRIKFEEESINDLSASIKEHGVIQPLVVRKIGDKYEIIAGERRYKASVMAGLETVPVIITDLNDKDSAEVALIENVQRQNLTPIEEAISYKKILDMGYLTQEQLANKLGKSQSAIANKLRLLNLDDEVQEALLNGQISERHARSLLKISNHKKQIEMLNRIIDERLTVRRTDEEIDKMLNSLFESDGEEKNLEKEEELEQTQPLSFDFSSFDNNDSKKNIFDIQDDMQNNNFSMPSDNSTDFFGFNQNIMDNVETEDKSMQPIKDDYDTNPTSNDFVDVNKIEEQAQDLFQKEEKKDINSFLEPTLLVNDEEDINKPVSAGFTFDQINSSVEQEPSNDLASSIFSDNKEEPVQPTIEQPVEEKKEENKELDEVNLDPGMQPGKFFNLFNDTTFNPEEKPTFTDFNETFDSVEQPKEEPSKENNESNFSNMFEANNLEDNLTEVVPQKLEAEDVNDSTVKSKDNNNVDVALEKIRQYTEELKKLGINVNIEESDFENKYQVTINIDK